LAPLRAPGVPRHVLTRRNARRIFDRLPAAEKPREIGEIAFRVTADKHTRQALSSGPQLDRFAKPEGVIVPKATQQVLGIALEAVPNHELDLFDMG
jgi:hypothetical protein